MRLDRFLSLHLFNLLTKGVKSRDKLRIPILMYHSISEDVEEGMSGYYKINTAPRIFSKHMKYLHENGYSVIDLTEAVRMITSHPCPKTKDSVIPSGHHPSSSSLEHSNTQWGKYVVLTFDDGYRDFYTHAFPILGRYGISATVFLPTSFIDNGKSGLRGKEHLSWREIQELNKEGITFGSHTMTHPQLKLLERQEIEYEIKYSKQFIEEKIGRSVESFSYPFAFPEENAKLRKYLRGILEESAYRNAVSTRIGTTKMQDDVFCLRRLPVNSSDDMRLFGAKLEGYYDWVYKPQYLSKVFKNMAFRLTDPVK